MAFKIQSSNQKLSFEKAGSLERPLVPDTDNWSNIFDPKRNSFELQFDTLETEFALVRINIFQTTSLFSAG